MSEKSDIQWCDSTHNFWRGCTKVSPGCANCYAEKLVTTRLGGEWGKGKPRIRSKSFDEPLKWNKKPWVCSRCGECFPDTMRDGKFEICPICFKDTNESILHRRRVFSLSLGDWLDDEVPIEWLADMLDVIRRCPNLDFLLLTKRPRNWLRSEADLLDFCHEKDMAELFGWLMKWRKEPPHNIWLGTSVENQKTAHERIPELLKIPARIRFLSVEPLLSAVDLLRPYCLTCKNSGRADSIKGAANCPECDGGNPIEGGSIHWVIVGGESGQNARPCNVEWIRLIKDQCKASGAACFVKQLGANPVCDCSVSVESFSANCVQHFKNPIHDKKGGDISEWPGDLQVREFPTL